MIEEEEWTGRMQGNVCVRETKTKKEHKQPVGTARRDTIFHCFIYHIHLYTPHIFIHVHM